MPFRLSWPCDTHIRVTQYFMANPQTYARFGLPGHDGIDFGTPENAPIYAAADGIVLTVSFQSNGYGHWIKLRHAHDDGVFFTIVAHLNRVRVGEGQTVRVGDVIGLSGDTGFSTAPHLHFSLQWHGATDKGFTRYRGFGREATFPRDFVDPAPYLVPALKSPVQPVNPRHPALHFDDKPTSSQPVTDAAVTNDDPTPNSIPVRVRNTKRVGGLKVRSQPNTSGIEAARLTDGTLLRVKPGIEEVGPLTWRQIVSPAAYRDKWVAQSFYSTQYLEETPEIETTTTPISPTEAENPREATTDQPAPPAPPTEVARPTPDAIGMRVQNVASVGGLKVRPQPSTAGTSVVRLPNATTLWVRPVTRDGGAIQWRQLLTPAAYRDMWVAQNFHSTYYLKQIEDEAVVVEPAPTTHPDTITESTPVTPEPTVITTSTPTTPPPTDAETMVVANTGTLHLNVREDTTLGAAIIAELKDGTLVKVKRQAATRGSIVWRQLVEPAQYAGNWVAERVYKTHYLIPAPDDSDLNAQAISVAAPTTATPVSTTSAAVLNSIEPAPLAGRITLVDKGLSTALAIDGDTAQRMGVNVRELAYFGTSEWPWTNESQRDAFCDEAAKLGMTWVRFYAPHKNYTHDQIVARTRATLDAIHTAGLLGIVVLGDSLAETGLYPAGDESFHTESMGHIHKRYWHDKSYEVNYIPLLQRLVAELKDHPGLGMWQLMNEPAIYPQPASTADADAFAAFVDRASSLIYDEDVMHPISIGIINVAHVAPSTANHAAYPRKYFAARKYIHVATCHCYQHTKISEANALWDQEERANVDAKAAADTDRAFMLTEFGPSHAGNRAASSEAFLRRQLQGNHACGALQWGFMPTGSDVGVGDKLFGLSRANINREYDQLVGLYSQFRSRFHLV